MCFPVSPAPQSLPSAARHPARPVSFHGPRFLSPPDLQAPATPLPPPCYGCSRGLATSWAAQPLCKVLAPWRPACVQPARYPTTASDVTLADTREPRNGGRAKPPGEVKNVASESKVISHAWLQRPRVVTKPRIMYHAWLVSAKVPLCHAWLDQPRVVHTFRICCHTWLRLLESCTTRGI